MKSSEITSDYFTPTIYKLFIIFFIIVYYFLLLIDHLWLP